MYAIIAASNQVDKLYVVLSSSVNRDKEICNRDGIKYIPSDVRLSWLGENLNNLDNIKIIHIEDDQWDDNYDWEAGANMIKEAIGKPIDFVFSSEDSYNKLFEKFYPNAKHVIIDNNIHKIKLNSSLLKASLQAFI